MRSVRLYDVFQDGELIAEGVRGKDVYNLAGIGAENVWNYAKAGSVTRQGFSLRFHTEMQDATTPPHDEYIYPPWFCREWQKITNLFHEKVQWVKNGGKKLTIGRK